MSFSHTNDTTFWCQDDTPVLQCGEFVLVLSGIFVTEEKLSGRAGCRVAGLLGNSDLILT